MRAHVLQRFFLVVVLLMMAAPPAFAAVARPRQSVEARSASAATVLAGSWSIGKYVAAGGRTRVVQICVVVMCFALFVLMKKIT